MPNSKRVAQLGQNPIEQILRHAQPAARKVLRAVVDAHARHTLFLPNHPAVIAVSGGADSVCLLHALVQLAPHWGVALHVAHIDHGLRPDAGEDARFVAELAQSYALPLHTTQLESRIVDDAVGGLEAAARSARYAFLRHVATQLERADTPAPVVTVATGHHQDDQAETLLLHLIQGSGLHGLAGMAWVGELPDTAQPPVRLVRLVRPLLGLCRADLHAYLHSYALAWREDSSNLDVHHARNLVRHQVLPLLATLNPNIHATLARNADLLAAEVAHADQRDRTALAAVTRHTHTPSTRLALDLFHLAQYDRATQRGVLRLALQTLQIDLRTVGVEGIDTLLAALYPPHTCGPHPLGDSWAWSIVPALTRADTSFQRQAAISPAGPTNYQLVIHRAEALPLEPQHPHLGAPLAKPIAVPTTGALVAGSQAWRLCSSHLAPDALPADWRDRRPPWHFYGDAEAAGALRLTTFRPGMSMAPLGMGGHTRALGDIFTDHKIPPVLRAGWPVVVNAQQTVVWLCGLVVAEAVRIQSSTRQVRHLCWHCEASQGDTVQHKTETAP